MAKGSRPVLLGVHGIRNFDPEGPEHAQAVLARRWTAHLRKGLQEVAYPKARLVDIKVAYYANLLSDDGEPEDQGLRDPDIDGGDDLVAPSRELTREDALYVRSREALKRHLPTKIDLSNIQPAFSGMRTRINRGLDLNGAMAQERFAMTTSDEVVRLLEDVDSRRACVDIVQDQLRSLRPSIVIAHSLGSVVTYDALHATSEVPVDLFLTLGSPLGAPTTIFPSLNPAPVNGRGTRPPSVARWINICDPGDIIALVQDLASCFDGVDADLHPSIGPVGSHAVARYLRTPTVGGVLAQFLD